MSRFMTLEAWWLNSDVQGRRKPKQTPGRVF